MPSTTSSSLSRLLASSYASALQTYHGIDSFHSGNLYQIFSYLKNAAGGDPTFKTVEGILLYPQVQHEINASYFIQGHHVKVATLDLSRPWPAITDRLLELLDSTPETSKPVSNLSQRLRRHEATNDPAAN
jgi:5-methylcytosine-specific restriction enzyme subunit McrC